MTSHLTFETLDSEGACRALREVGVNLLPGDVHVEPREERWLVTLPDRRIAWFPASDRGLERLTVDRRVLRLLADRCTFRVPKILVEAPSGFDVREMVPGSCEPWKLYGRIQADRALACGIGRSVGAILAQQHTRIAEADVTGWLPRRPAWPMPGDWIRERLPDVVDDRELLSAIEGVFRAYESTALNPADCALVHADLGLHNLPLDNATDQVTGVFDYDEAAWTDPHHDFRYLVFDFERPDMLEAALAVYEPAVGRTIDRTRVRLYNAACAISFLALRVGIPADKHSCGRTLDEDLRWVRGAVSRVAAARS
jgi:hypothetical protein